MPKPPKSARIAIKFPEEGFGRPYFANRYSSFKESSCFRFQFGLLLGGEWISNLAVVLSETAVLHVEQTVGPYIQSIKNTFQNLKAEEESKLSGNPELVYANMWKFAYYGEIGQISFAYISPGSIANLREEPPVGPYAMKAEPLVRIDMPIGVHYGFIERVYVHNQ